MNVAFMTSAISAKRNSTEKYSTLESMDMLYRMGFDRQDLSLNRMMFNESEFNGDDWETLAREVRDRKEKLGITFVQAHLPFRCMNYFDRPQTYADAVEHIVWFENARSSEAMLRLVAEYGLTGAGVWNIMRYFPSLWLIANQLYSIRKFG